MRYSDYLNQVNVRHRTINHNLLTALAKPSASGSLAPPKIDLSFKQLSISWRRIVHRGLWSRSKRLCLWRPI